MTEKSSDSEPTSESPSPDTPKHTMTSHAITDQTFDSSHRRVHYNPESTTGSRDLFSDSDPLIFQRFRTYGMGTLERKPRHPRRKETRLITADGHRNTTFKNVTFSMKATVTGAFQRLVNLGWPGQFMVFSGCFLVSWFFFALLWWTLEEVGRRVHTHNDQSSHWHCVSGLSSFYSAVLFSIETQTTIGYGSHYVTNDCYPGFVILFLQVVCGSILQGVLVAIVISKFSHPKFRRADILFSKNLCISEENQQFLLSFRVADSFNGAMSMPQSHVRVYLIHSVSDDDEDGGEYKTTPGTGCMAMQELDVGYEKGQDRVVLMVPWVVQHVIDADSPLYNKCYDDINHELFEIVVILEGSVEETGSVTQCLKSYVSKDVLWGYTFDSMISKRKGKFQIDFAKLDSCSPQGNVPVFLAQTVPKKKLSTFNPWSVSSASRSLRNRRKSVHASYQASKDEMEDEEEEEEQTTNDDSVVQPMPEMINDVFSINAIYS